MSSARGNKKTYYRKKNYNSRNNSKSKYYYKYKNAKDVREAKAKEEARKRGPGFISAGGEALGTAAGSLFGPAAAKLGGLLGGKLGHLVEQITGFGDYKIQQNSIMKGGMTAPQIVNSSNKGGVIIRHREFIGDITATTGFNVQSYLIQPGLVTTFPWMSQIANAYEQYRLRGMIFEFQSTSSDALLSSATSTALGTVTMQTDYDVADAPPSSKRQMLACEFSCTNKPSCSFIHPIECKKSLTPQSMLYTRGSISPPAGFDQRLYDFARFNIATEGMQSAGGVLGSLFIIYEIELFKPQFAFFGLADHIRSSVISAGTPFGTTVPNQSAITGSTLLGKISDDHTTYEFPTSLTEGLFYVSYQVVGPGTVGVTRATPTLTNCTFVNIIGAGTLGPDQIAWTNAPEPAATAGCQIWNAVIRITTSPAKITFANNGVWPVGPNTGDLFVIQLPESIIKIPV